MRCKWLDPGVELLFWQFLGHLVYAALPQALANIVGRRVGHFSCSPLWIVVLVCELNCSLSKPYPHEEASRVELQHYTPFLL
jgi:hypothetical protein